MQPSRPERHQEGGHLLTKGNCRQLDVERLWHRLGRLGKYQLFQSLLLFLGGIGLAPPLLSGIFTGKDVRFRCAANMSQSSSSTNSSAFVSSCEDLPFTGNTSSQVHPDGSCHEYVYEGGHRHASYVSEWDLVCEREALAILSQVMVMVGNGFGAFFLPPLGDRFGRKKLLVASELTVVASSLALAFSSSFNTFAVFKFIAGAANMGQGVAAATLHMELYPIEQRSAVCYVYVVIWCTSYALFVAISWLLQDYAWTTLQLALTCCSAGVFLQIFFQEESLRWLLTKGHVHKARVLLVKACRWNGKDYDQLMRSVTDDQPDKVNQDTPTLSNQDKAIELKKEEAQAFINDQKTCEPTTKNISSSIFDLFRTRRMAMITLISAYAWFISSLTYYGLTLMSSSLFGDPYLNNLVAAILELLFGLVMFYAIFKFGRKHTLIVFILLAGTFLLATQLVETFAPQSEGFFILQTVLAQLGKCFISGSFNTVWCYTQELYPTYMRNMGIGFSSTAARVGSSISPLFKPLAKQAPWAPGTIFSVCCFLCSFMLVAMPETRYRQLPNSIAEIEGWFCEEKKNKKDKSRNKKDNFGDKRDNSTDKKVTSMETKDNSRNNDCVIDQEEDCFRSKTEKLTFV